jgi:hypothetical protein
MTVPLVFCLKTAARPSLAIGSFCAKRVQIGMKRVGGRLFDNARANTTSAKIAANVMVAQ